MDGVRDDTVVSIVAELHHQSHEFTRKYLFILCQM